MTRTEPGKDVTTKRIVNLSLWKPKNNGTLSRTEPKSEQRHVGSLAWKELMDLIRGTG